VAVRRRQIALRDPETAEVVVVHAFVVGRRHREADAVITLLCEVLHVAELVVHDHVLLRLGE